MTLAGSFLDVVCDNPECGTVLRVPAGAGDTGSFAERAWDELSARGWTKDPRGLDLCSECSARMAGVSPILRPRSAPRYSTRAS
jgi:hypothetical protein